MKKFFKFFSFKRIMIYLLFAFLILQVIPVDRQLPSSNPKNDFLAVNQTPETEMQLIKTACYNCHSNNSQYPWYAKVAPFSMWIQGHINNGREELNFSLWDSYTAKKKDHKLEECAEMLQEKKMPLKSYTFIHREAKLNQGERDQLIQYFNRLR